MTSKNFQKNNSGFTLVETLVTIFIFTIIMIGTTMLAKAIFSTSNQQNLALDIVDRARLAIAGFTNEIRNSTSGNDGSFALNQASDSQIIFYSTYGATGTKVNRIRYFISGTTLYKGIIVPTGTPLVYNSASEATTTVITGIASTTAPLFYYYDSNYAGTSTPLSQPVNLNNVKFVKINLILQTQDVRNSTTTFSIAVGATIRNLKTNLGN